MDNNIDSRYETSPREIMQAGVSAILDMIKDKPAVILIKDDLEHLVGALAANWLFDRESNGKEE